jgi:hypothetical protein
MTFDEFERTAREMFDEIPPELRGGVEYLVVSKDTVPHPELPEIYTLGECATGEYDVGVDAPGAVRSGVHLYYGSFRALAGLHDDFDWEGELWETLTHEVMHHRESTAGEDALEDLDYAEDENFKRREGLPFDPFFYRMGAPVDEGTWEVDGDLFVERAIEAAEFAASPELAVRIEGEELTVPRPDALGDVHFVYLDGLYEEQGDIALVLVRRRGTLESLRSLFRTRGPEVLESSVTFGE